MLFEPGQGNLPAWSLAGLAVPIGSFDVIVLGNSQAMAAAQSPSLEHPPAIGGGHASAKAMDTQSAADLGLIGSLWHENFLTSFTF